MNVCWVWEGKGKSHIYRREDKGNKEVSEVIMKIYFEVMRGRG